MRQVLVLSSDAIRQKAHAWVDSAPEKTRLEFKDPKRTLDQNALLWAFLTDISKQAAHHGMKLTPEDWRFLFLDALDRETRMVPNLDGNGYVAIGRSTSDLSVREFSDLLEIIQAWGASHGIVFGDRGYEL